VLLSPEANPFRAIVMVLLTVAYTIMLFFRYQELRRSRKVTEVIKLIEAHEEEGLCTTCQYFGACQAMRKNYKEMDDL